MDGVGTPIIGRPRPLPGHDTPNPAYHPHTLNYEEPVNSTSLKDGIIVRFKDENYRVHLNEDNNSYTLERTHIIDHNVYVDGKH